MGSGLRCMAIAVMAFCGTAMGQVCKTGLCKQTTNAQPAGAIISNSVGVAIELLQLPDEMLVDEPTQASDYDRLSAIQDATIRVTVSGVCGSGTIVGKTSAGNALILTNAHVAGTQRGRQVNVERWNQDGTSEKATAKIVSAGYGRGLSVDFAILEAASGFGANVVPIPLADRYPEGPVETNGCPRCEWPSMQVLRMEKSNTQVLAWKPQAIGGRSGSSLIDFADEAPRVVGLLTWGSTGQGLGQSTPFLLQAMRGRLPAQLEALPTGIWEVGTQVPEQEAPGSDTGLIDRIIGERKPNDSPKDDPDRRILKPDLKVPGVGLFGGFFQFLRRALITILLVAAAGVSGFLLGRYWK
jgi:hypothetical protein